MVSNNCGAMETGLAVLLAAERIARVTGSYIARTGVRAAGSGRVAASVDGLRRLGRAGHPRVRAAAALGVPRGR